VSVTCIYKEGRTALTTQVSTAVTTTTTTINWPFEMKGSVAANTLQKITSIFQKYSVTFNVYFLFLFLSSLALAACIVDHHCIVVVVVVCCRVDEVMSSLFELVNRQGIYAKTTTLLRMPLFATIRNGIN